MRRLVPLAAAAFLASCMGAPEEPSPWAVGPVSEDCRALAGTYVPVGQSQSGYTPYLSGYLFGALPDEQTRTRSYQADRIEIAVDGVNLRARGMRGANELATQTIPCERGVAHVPSPPQTDRADVDRMNTWLYAGQDGALIVKRSEGAGGFYTIVPANMSETRWYRFARTIAPDS